MFMQYQAFLLVTKYGREAAVRQRKSQNNASCSGSKKLQEKKTIYLNKKFLSLNLCQKADLLEVRDKGKVRQLMFSRFASFSIVPRQVFSL